VQATREAPIRGGDSLEVEKAIAAVDDAALVPTGRRAHVWLA
jgi:hypothetical protein